MKTLLDVFAHFEMRRDTTALIYRTGVRRFVFSYAELFRLSMQCAVWIKKQGIAPGDRIVIWAPNSPWWAVAFWGSILSGAVIIPVDFASGKERARKIVTLSKAKLILQSRYAFDSFQSEDATILEDLEYLLADIASDTFVPATIHPSDMALLVYTSGTTGDPKGVVISHKNIVANLRQVNTHIVLDSSYCFLSLLPLSHLFEFTCGFLSPLYLGGSIIYRTYAFAK